MAGKETRGHCTALAEDEGKQPGDIHHGNSYLKSIWDTQWRASLLILECVPKRQCSWTDPSRNKGTGQLHLPPLTLSISTGPPVGTSALLGQPFPGMLALVPMQWPLLPQKTSPNPAQTTSPNVGVLQSLGSNSSGDSCHFTTRPEQT